MLSWYLPSSEGQLNAIMLSSCIAGIVGIIIGTWDEKSGCSGVASAFLILTEICDSQNVQH